jgi:hypothetical protein
MRESLLARKLGGAHKAATVTPVAHKACQTEALDEPIREPPPMPPPAEEVSVHRTPRDVSACAVLGWVFVAESSRSIRVFELGFSLVTRVAQMVEVQACAATVPCVRCDQAAESAAPAHEGVPSTVGNVSFNTIPCKKGSYGASFLRKAMREIQQVRSNGVLVEQRCGTAVWSASRGRGPSGDCAPL